MVTPTDIKLYNRIKKGIYKKIPNHYYLNKEINNNNHYIYNIHKNK